MKRRGAWIASLGLVVFPFLHASSDRSVAGRIQPWNPAQAHSAVRGVLAQEADGCFYADENQVLEWLREGYVNPCAVDPESGASLLHVAAQCGACHVVDHLLHKYRVPWTRDHQGRTPLHLAVNPRFGRVSPRMISLLIGAHETSVFEADSDHQFPFFCACSYDEEVVDWFVWAGFDVDRVDDKGKTPLFYYKDSISTSVLCSRGAGVNRVDFGNLSLLGAHMVYYFDALEKEGVQETNMTLDLADIKRSIKTLLWHGARVPLCYHPAYPIKVPHGDKERHRMRAERRELIQQLFCSIMDDIEGGLVWLRLRMRVISAELVFDSVMQTLPFFKTRVAEAKEIFEKEKSCGKRADEEQYDEEAELCRMLLPPMSSCALPRFIRLMVKVIANPPSASSAHDKSQWGLFFLGELFPPT